MLIPSFPPWLATYLKWVESMSISTWVRTSTFGYPLLEIVHLIGIATLFGTVLLVDLSVLTQRRRPPLEQWGPVVLRLTVIGFLIALGSGVLLLMARASEIGPNLAFWLKMLLLVLAGLNAWLFHRQRGLTQTRGPIRIQAAASILIWIAIIACGRLIAYV